MAAVDNILEKVMRVCDLCSSLQLLQEYHCDKQWWMKCYSSFIQFCSIWYWMILIFSISANFDLQFKNLILLFQIKFQIQISLSKFSFQFKTAKFQCRRYLFPSEWSILWKCAKNMRQEWIANKKFVCFIQFCSIWHWTVWFCSFPPMCSSNSKIWFWSFQIQFWIQNCKLSISQLLISQRMVNSLKKGQKYGEEWRLNENILQIHSILFNLASNNFDFVHFHQCVAPIQKSDSGLSKFNLNSKW